MNHKQNENYQRWVDEQMEEGNEWEEEMVELEKQVTAKLQNLELKTENTSDSVHLDFSRTDSTNLELEENTIIIRDLTKALEYIDCFGINIRKISINAENLNKIEISILMRIVYHNCTMINSINLMFFKHGFSSDIEYSVNYIRNTKIHVCNFDTDTFMFLIRSSKQVTITN